MDKLEDHIDEPIKKVVVGLALLGFHPVMSCCGFNYKGEKVAKTHLINKPYVYLDTKYLEAFHDSLLMRLAFGSGWTIDFNPKGNRFVDFWSRTWNKGHPWEESKCPHQPEGCILAINSLEQCIEKSRSKFQEWFNIVDGNSIYINEFKLKHWQYAPTDPWRVTPETFDNL